ncbi:MAG: DUF2461 domain-containing protein [Cyclobacteriaceae bacterium]|nr:DUF2461 domain-containing protein [Cyclobacteriaceae bacterium]
MISKELFHFLKNLKANNTREWFNDHKPTFQKHQAEVKAFYQEVEARLSQTDQIEKHKVFRIYRDVRFSKDKTPYKTRFAGYFIRATRELRGGYYLNIEPGNCIVGGGFYGPEPDDLKRIRQEFEQDDSEIRAILNNKKFKSIFGKLQGSELKSAPRGFDPAHSAIDLIRKKQFYVLRSFTDKEVQSPDFINQVMETYLAMRPYFDYMSAVLTTNMDGESML